MIWRKSLCFLIISLYLLTAASSLSEASIFSKKQETADSEKSKLKAEEKSEKKSKVKSKTDKPKKAPRFPKKGIWLNATPPGRKVYDQKVTLVYFWDYTSINCLREFRYLRRLYDRYRPYGLEMIFVHSPEFEFAKKKEYVQWAALHFHIPYPIFLDNDFKIWDAFKVLSWPTKVLVDQNGIISYSQVGEENDLKFEEKVRETLGKLNSSTVLPSPLLEEERKKFSTRECGEMNAETYTGYKRANWWGGEIADDRRVLPDQTLFYRDSGKRANHGFFVHGQWTNRADHFEHARETDEVSDYLGILYSAYEVYGVINQGDGLKLSRVYVTRDGKPVPIPNRGMDVKEDSEGGTYILLQEPRLYYLIANEDEHYHELKLWTTSQGVGINSFSFSNECLSDFEHL